MPRDPSEFPNPPEPIPDLTRENTAQMGREADHIAVSFRPKEPREFLDSMNPGRIAGLRFRYMWYELFNTAFEGEINIPDFGTTRKCGKTKHAFFFDTSEDFVERVEEFFESMVPLWECFTISFCWTEHSHPRVNTLIYQLEDRMPPDPQTPAFFRETGIDTTRDDLTEEEIEVVMEGRDAYWEFEDTPDNPRYSYGLTHILNGDYDVGGADLTAYGWEFLDIDLRYFPAKQYDEVKERYGPNRFPTLRSPGFYENLVEFVPDYPDHIGVETIDDRTLMTEVDTPAPLIPEKPD